MPWDPWAMCPVAAPSSWLWTQASGQEFRAFCVSDCCFCSASGHAFTGRSVPSVHWLYSLMLAAC